MLLVSPTRDRNSSRHSNSPYDGYAGSMQGMIGAGKPRYRTSCQIMYGAAVQMDDRELGYPSSI